MSSTENFLGSKTWTLPIGNGTLTIALSFIFLAYILHPAIESAYHRLRAYRAWRSIQKRNTVEVTTYPMLAEVCGGRGVWDAARIITVLLFAFSLASWGLELSMDLASLEGEADLLNRPPPVFLLPETNDTTTDPWQVNLLRIFYGAFAWNLLVVVYICTPFHLVQLQQLTRGLMNLKLLSRRVCCGNSTSMCACGRQINERLFNSCLSSVPECGLFSRLYAST